MFESIEAASGIRELDAHEQAAVAGGDVTVVVVNGSDGFIHRITYTYHYVFVNGSMQMVMDSISDQVIGTWNNDRQEN